MTAGPGPAQPDRADENDRLVRRVLWSLPTGLYVIGSAAGDRLNGMTANWVVQVATSPRRLAVGVQKDALTLELIRSGACFSVNLLARADSAVVRRFVKPVEADLEAHTLNGFGWHTEATGAPVLDRALAWVDCRLDREVDLDSHSLMVGAVVAAGFQQPEETPVLRMEDTRMNYGG